MKLSSLVIAALTFFPYAAGQDTHFEPQGDQIPGPVANDPAAQKAWLADMRQWRRERRIRAGFDDSEYKRPELLWTQRNFVSPQAMVEDRYFYDPAARRYTVDRFLDDLDKRYGGIDSVLLWPVYPNIGIDNRSQWDLTLDLPGGVPALHRMVEDFHRRGVRVLFPAMPWDTGTRDPGVSHAAATAQLMADIGADGVNGDTFGGVPRTYRTASDATGHPVAFEPEGAPQSDEGLIWNSMNWAYWKFPFAPLAAKAKWIEPRHMEHVSDRWARDKTDDLQYAFFNGIGYVSWENVWGIWNGITPRGAETLRRVAKIERFFADALGSPDWEPFYPTLQHGVFSSLFPGKRGRLWTVINRNEYQVRGAQFEAAGLQYIDVWHGVPLDKPEFEIEAHGYGAILELPVGPMDADLMSLLAQMKELSATPLASYSNEWKFLPQKLVEIAAAHGSHTGMIAIPGGAFNFRVHGVEIEGENWVGLDVQYPWEDSPRRSHQHWMEMKPFFMDKYPVTNAEFKSFLEASHYHPEDDHNFLKDWTQGSYPEGWADRPVTWVSLEDARAYSKWAGKRLPHEWEWQYAAEGSPEIAASYHGRDLPGPSKVNAHDEASSRFGVQDMLGNVWQWTDEYLDEHTRAAILRGGSYYRPNGSMWYFPQNTKLDEHGKYLLMAPSKDRAGTLGFRCVVDGE
jgi:iron(II)-dependent oxidoreductase